MSSRSDLKSTTHGKKQPIVEEEVKERKKSKCFSSFKTFIYKILKASHKDLSISEKGMEILESILKDIFEKLAKECSLLAKYRKAHTIGIQEVLSAAHLHLPGELGIHGIKEAKKACEKFKVNKL